MFILYIIISDREGDSFPVFKAYSTNELAFKNYVEAIKTHIADIKVKPNADSWIIPPVPGNISRFEYWQAFCDDDRVTIIMKEIDVDLPVYEFLEDPISKIKRASHKAQEKKDELKF